MGNLKAWFGNSKVADQTGNPMVLYHGTGADFDKFKGMMFWASTDPKLADEYSDIRKDEGGIPSIYPVYMKINNWFDADELPNSVTIGAFFSKMLEQARHTGMNPNTTEIAPLITKLKEGARTEESGPYYGGYEFWYKPTWKFGANADQIILKIFQLMGFDGIKLTEAGYLTFGVFARNQVKSAIGNIEYSDDDSIVKEAMKTDANTTHRASAESSGYDTSIVYYHGTTKNFDFQTFKSGKNGINELGNGIYVSSDPQSVDYWAGTHRGMTGRIIPVYLKNGEIYDATSSNYKNHEWYLQLVRRIKQHYGKIPRNPIDELDDINGYSDDVLANHIEKFGRANFNDYLKAAGYIGKKNDNSQIKGQVVVFDPSYLKSAIGNKGTYDPNETSIIKESSDKFKQWFGNSKVVDASGKPLVMYHGTIADFDTFDNSKTGQNDRGLWGRGHYFASNPDTANSYALRQGDNARIIPVYLSIRNPLVLKTGKDLITRLPDGTNTKTLIGDNLDGSKIKELAINGGHDGIIQIKPNGSIGDAVAFTPSQIKSAIGNSGEYSSDDSIIKENDSNLMSWFGKSVVKNKDGSPRKVYHGTNSDFNQFSLKNRDNPIDQLGMGIYLTDNPEVADSYTGGDGGNIMPLYVKITKPITEKTPAFNRIIVKQLITSSPNYKDSLENFGDIEYEGEAKVLAVAIKSYIDGTALEQLNMIANDFWDGHDEEFLQAVIKLTKHDGLIARDYGDHHIYVVWSPSQIKSAIGNSGEYSGDNLINEEPDLQTELEEDWTNYSVRPSASIIESTQKCYYRGTNNPHEEELVRSRTLRASINHITKKPEVGVSVSDVDSVGDYFDYLYILTGKEVGLGSDMEPLLAPDSICFVKWIKKPELQTELEEGWKNTLTGLGTAAAIALGGMAYKDSKKPVEATSKPSIVTPTAVPLQTNTEAEKFLATIAKKAGMKGIELAQFLAQCAHETGNFMHLKEIGNKHYFTKKYDITGNPAKAKVLGNTKPGDGVKYHGRGYIQLTGKAQYAKASEHLGIDLVNKPQLAEEPEIAAQIAVWYWNHRVKPKVNDFEDTHSVTKLVNGRLKGIDDRIEKFNAYSQLNEMAAPLDSMKQTVYYHGTSSDSAAKSIMQHGLKTGDIVMPDRYLKKQRGPNLTPMKGKVYVTDNIGLAQIYAIGGDVAGSSYKPKDRKYGYVFSIDGNQFQDIDPDEDSVGELIYKNIKSDDPRWKELVRLARAALTPKQWDKFVYAEYELFAHVGKKLMSKLSDAQKYWIIENGGNIAHTGNLMPSAVYRIDLDNIQSLKRDGSNFFDYAEKLSTSTNLLEAASSEVYHYSDLHSAYDIIKSKQFKLTVLKGHEIELNVSNKAQDYYLSTTRSKVGGYHKDNRQGVVFNIDGNKVNQRYKASAVDYWNDRDPKKAYGRTHEAEDRIYSNDPIISFDIVTAVHILYTNPSKMDERAAKRVTMIRQMVIECKKSNIPVYVYDNNKSWVVQDIRKAMPISYLDIDYVNQQPPIYRHKPDYGLAPYIELIFMKDKEKLSKRASSKLYDIKYGYDKHAGFKADWHNAKKPGSQDYENAKKIVKYMRKNNIKTINELMDNIKQRWTEQ